MSIILSVSFLIRIIALIIAVNLWYRIKDWRFGFISAMVALMALRQFLTMSKKDMSWSWSLTTNLDEMPGLAVSILALLAILFLGRMILAERRRSSDLLAINKQLSIQIEKREQAESEKLSFSQVIEQSPESIFITNLKGEIEYVNQSFINSTGYQAEDVLGKNPRIFKSNKTPPETYSDLWENLESGETWQGELYNKRKDGSDFIEWAIISPIRNLQGEISHYMAIKKDITEKKKSEEKIFYLAYYDSLTNLPNRVSLVDHLSRSIDACKELACKGAICLINVDRFKNINEARGHSHGDIILKAVGRRLNGLINHDQMLFKLSSDEFAILLPKLGNTFDMANEHAHILAKKVHDSLSVPFLINNEELAITVSMGITFFPETNDDSSFVLRRANMALNRAKNSGGNQSIFFESEMTDSVETRFSIERELRLAIANNQLSLYLQSQFDSKNNVTGAEVLVRWNHPDKGYISPAVFIPIAEETDLIIELSEWVFTHALRILSSIRQEIHFPFSINLSNRHFRQSNFIPWLEGLIESFDIEPGSLTLEVTEGLVIEDVEHVISKMEILSGYGIKFAIDDFGTGYSSLAYLKRLPVDEIKIDKTFIQDAPENPGDAALVETMISYADHMGLKIVAEGVENEAHANLLKHHPNIIYQGFLYGRPEPADTWIKNNIKSLSASEQKSYQVI